MLLLFYWLILWDLEIRFLGVVAYACVKYIYWIEPGNYKLLKMASAFSETKVFKKFKWMDKECMEGSEGWEFFTSLSLDCVINVAI